MLTALLSPETYPVRQLLSQTYWVVAVIACAYFAYCAAARLIASHAKQELSGIIEFVSPAYYGILLVAILMKSGATSNFIYFKF